MIALGIVVLHLTGCAATYRTPGSESLPLSQLAILEHNSPTKSGITITKVDGKGRGFGIFERFELTPGEHSITAYPLLPYHGPEITRWFHAKEAGAYRVEAILNTTNRKAMWWSLGVTDKETGQRVDYGQPNNGDTSSTVSESEVPVSIKAFSDICLKTGPSFVGAFKEANAYGVSQITDAGFMKMGFNKDQSLGVQIKENNECVITTPKRHDESLTEKFIHAVSQKTRVSASQGAPFKGEIGKDVFIFQHDRNGGEAFVMLKING